LGAGHDPAQRLLQQWRECRNAISHLKSSWTNQGRLDAKLSRKNAFYRKSSSDFHLLPKTHARDVVF
jgi:hypothetical protein